jgi:hypothetical protein
LPSAMPSAWAAVVIVSAESALYGCDFTFA